MMAVHVGVIIVTDQLNPVISDKVIKNTDTYNSIVGTTTQTSTSSQPIKPEILTPDKSYSGELHIFIWVLCISKELNHSDRKIN